MSKVVKVKKGDSAVESKPPLRPISYKLDQIKVNQVTINNVEKVGLDEINDEKVNFNMSSQSAFSNSHKMFAVTIQVTANYDHKEDELQLFSMETSTYFKLRDFEDYLKINEESQKVSLKLPKELLVNLFSIAYSTTRGILVPYTRGTKYDHILLPVINPYDFLNKKK